MKKIEILKKNISDIASKISNTNNYYYIIVSAAINSIPHEDSVKMYNTYAQLSGLDLVEFSTRSDTYCIVKDKRDFTHKLTEYILPKNFINIVLNNESSFNPNVIDALALGLNKFIFDFNKELSAFYIGEPKETKYPNIDKLLQNFNTGELNITNLDNKESFIYNEYIYNEFSNMVNNKPIEYVWEYFVGNKHSYDNGFNDGLNDYHTEVLNDNNIDRQVFNYVDSEEFNSFKKIVMASELQKALELMAECLIRYDYGYQKGFAHGDS